MSVIFSHRIRTPFKVNAVVLNEGSSCVYNVTMTTSTPKKCIYSLLFALLTDEIGVCTKELFTGCTAWECFNKKK